jgi:hypothetical protein
MHDTIWHRDGSITYWDSYTQSWVHTHETPTRGVYACEARPSTRNRKRYDRLHATGDWRPRPRPR